jgi:hypothetical protein
MLRTGKSCTHERLHLLPYFCVKNQSIPDIFGGKPQERYGYEKTPVFLAKYWGF